MAQTVFQTWGVLATSDFGRIVFELVDRGEMRKTDRDSLDDFVGVYEFEEALDRASRPSGRQRPKSEMSAASPFRAIPRVLFSK